MLATLFSSIVSSEIEQHDLASLLNVSTTKQILLLEGPRIKAVAPFKIRK